MLETWHRLNRKRISVYSEMLLETTVIVDFKWPCKHAEVLLNIAVILNPKDLNTEHFSFGKLE
jgi:hypothetical protein